MSVRIFAIALLAVVISSPVIAQGGGGGAAGSSSAGGGGAAPSGTGGVSPSTSNPAIGTPGVPGPTNGAGLPGGPGPGNTAAAPTPPAASPSSPAAAPASSDAGAGSTITSTNSGLGGGSPATNGKALANAKSPANAKRTETQGTSAAASEFHPEAVIDQSLGQASADIAAMSSAELRQLVMMFDLCTWKQHPTDREGKCAAASKRYSSTFSKNRAVDRALAELERVVRFQRMFRTANAPSTEYEDNINNRLRGAARIALATTDQTAQVSLKRQGARR